MDQLILSQCFDDFQIAHYRKDEGYKMVWYDALGVPDNTDLIFQFLATSNIGDIYILV
jgi:hypothetical protein